MSVALGLELELDVVKPVMGGRGLARIDGLVVFVEGALPGQKVAARITAVKKGFAEARVVTVLAQTPDYAAPFCPHFGVCGGCLWQDLAYPAQLRWKRELVLESLRRLEGIADLDVPPTAPSPMTRFFRNKMEFAFGEGASLGLHRRDDPGRVLDVTDCALMSETAMAILAEIRGFCRDSDLPAWNRRTGQGFWRHVVLREGKNTGQSLVQIIAAPAPGGPEAAYALGERLRRAFPDLTSYAFSTRKARTAVAAGEKTVFTLGAGSIEERVGGVPCRVSPDSFLQTNTGAAGELYRLAAAAGNFTGRETVWDLYAGSGGVALTLAPHVKKVLAVENMRSAVADAKLAMAASGLTNCEFLLGDVRETLEALNEPAPDAVVLDPPRGGAHPDVLASLLRLGPARIIYISCNPATLARDAALLAPGYRPVGLAPVDLFPHSPHVECVLILERKTA